MSLNFIDLYAGTSALSEGFTRIGINAVAHVEANQDACLTIATRAAYHFLRRNKKLQVYYDYLAGDVTRQTLYAQIPTRILDTVIHGKIASESVSAIFAKIDQNLQRVKNKDVDLIVGGPPCQAYSRRHRHGIDWKSDHRLSMYLDYARFLRRYNPKVFVFENVPGLLDARDGSYYRNLKKYFRRINYEIDDRVLNAKNYGVLQDRQRVFIVGWRKDLEQPFPNLITIEHEFTTEAIFQDLQRLQAGLSIQYGKYQTTSNPYLDRFQLRNGVDYYTQHTTRPHNENDLAIYRLVIDKWNKERKRLKYSEIPERLRTQKNTGSFLDRYKVVDSTSRSHTIIAHIAKDGHHYIHPDIAQCRSISVREAARIQSFPDDFFFEGTRTSAFRQIGNAVPPLLSHAFGRAIEKQLRDL